MPGPEEALMLFERAEDAVSWLTPALRPLVRWRLASPAAHPLPPCQDSEDTAETQPNQEPPTLLSPEPQLPPTQSRSPTLVLLDNRRGAGTGIHTPFHALP